MNGYNIYIELDDVIIVIPINNRKTIGLLNYLDLTNRTRIFKDTETMTTYSHIEGVRSVIVERDFKDE